MTSTRNFFLLAFAFTWTLQLPAVFAGLGLLPGSAQAYLPLAALGIFGPSAAALLLTARESGRSGVRTLLAGLGRWRVAPRWYVLALFVPGILLSAVLAGLHALGWPGKWSFLPGAAQLLIAVVVSLGEEVGWRGYALPRLTARYGAFGASGVLGALWALWHIPMFLAVGIPMSLGLVMLLNFIGGSLFFTWLVQRSGGSLLIAVLAHVGAHLNNSHAALPADMLPAVVHALIYASLGYWALRGSLPSPRKRGALWLRGVGASA